LLGSPGSSEVCGANVTVDSDWVEVCAGLEAVVCI
jgi:hypothetical protein